MALMSAKDFVAMREREKREPGWEEHVLQGAPAPGTPAFDALQQQRAADKAAQNAERRELEDQLEAFGAGHPGVRRGRKREETSR